MEVQKLKVHKLEVQEPDCSSSAPWLASTLFLTLLGLGQDFFLVVSFLVTLVTFIHSFCVITA